MDDPEAVADDIELGARSPEEVDRTERALGNAADDAVPAPHRGPVAAPDIRRAATASHPSGNRHGAHSGPSGIGDRCPVAHFRAGRPSTTVPISRWSSARTAAGFRGGSFATARRSVVRPVEGRHRCHPRWVIRPCFQVTYVDTERRRWASGGVTCDDRYITVATLSHDRCVLVEHKVRSNRLLPARYRPHCSVRYSRPPDGLGPVRGSAQRAAAT
jgi:hypothetical protein